MACTLDLMVTSFIKYVIKLRRIGWVLSKILQSLNQATAPSIMTKDRKKMNLLKRTRDKGNMLLIT